MGQFESSGAGQPLSEINTTPLVDVMLVLLVIFIITAPLMTRAVSLDLPKSETPVVTASPDTIHLSVNAQGAFFIDKKQVTLAELTTALKEAAAKNTRVPIHFRAERNTRYESVIEVMTLAHQLGLTQFAFVTNMPDSK